MGRIVQYPKVPGRLQGFLVHRQNRDKAGTKSENPSHPFSHPLTVLSCRVTPGQDHREWRNSAGFLSLSRSATAAIWFVSGTTQFEYAFANRPETRGDAFRCVIIGPNEACSPGKREVREQPVASRRCRFGREPLSPVRLVERVGDLRFWPI